MQTIEIPRSDWQRFLSDLSRQAANHAVRLEVDNLTLGSQEMTKLSPLQDIDLETEGSAAGALEITVGGEEMDLSHRIEHPSRLFVRYSSGLHVDCLGIEDLDGGTTLLMFDEFILLPEGHNIQAAVPVAEIRAP